MVKMRNRLITAAALVALVASSLSLAVAPMAQADPQQPGAEGASLAVDPPAAMLSERRGQKVVTLQGGLCAPTVPLGLVRFAGPAGTNLVARVRTSGESRLLTVVVGSGRIGDTRIRAKDVSGELTWRNGQMTGAVTINLPGHVKVSRTWTQSVTVNAQPSGCAWSSAVSLKATGVGASLDLRGPLATDGTYQLRGSGTVKIAKARVPVTGWFRSATSTTKPTWRITGTAREDVRIPGARITNVRLAMTQAESLVKGSGTLRLSAPTLAAPAVLEVAGANTWSATVTKSDRRSWVVPETDGLTVNTSRLSGSIGMRAGKPVWSLAAPGKVSIDSLDYLTSVGFTGPLNYSVRATAAIGSILGIPGSSLFAGAPSTLDISPRGITGALTVVTGGDLLLPVPDAWSGRTAYAVLPIEEQGWDFTAGLTHTMSAGQGTIRLTGPVVDGGVDLVGSGAIEISGSLVPVRGYYERSSFTDGSTPIWALAAFVDQAQGGRINLDGGAGMVGGVFVFDGPGAQPVDTISARGSAKATQLAPTVSAADSSEVTVTGTSTIQLSDSDDDTFYLPITYSYTDPNNWTATVNATTPSNLYNPYDGLEIPETDFSGTVTDVAGAQTWDVSIAMQEWQDFANGVEYQGAFTISNTCPLAADECPSDDSAIYLGGQSNLVFTDSSMPTIYATGAFTTDLTWARWDAVATEEITFVATDQSGGGTDIALSDPDVTIWKGERSDTNPDLVLPDLSSLNPNGFGLEFCSDFTVDIPDISTVNTYGCVEWGGSPTDVVIGQVDTAGAVITGAYNDITMVSTTVTGYAYNGIDDEQTVYLNGDEIVMQTGENYLTGDVVVAGNVMNDLGSGVSVDTTISTTGWFDTAGNFELDGTIPVNLSGSGFTLKEILITISKNGDVFDLRLDADATVNLEGNYFPLDVYIGYESSDSETITVGLTATGTESTQSEGTMDFITLIPTGNFEPTNASIVDGSFDGTMPANIATDGGFERSSTPGALVGNGNFEDGMNLNVLTDGDFEDGSSGNILANGDFESTQLLVNGDFEDNEGSLLGWQTSSSSFTATTTEGTAVGPTDQGSTLAVLSNNSVSNNTTQGLSQTIPIGLASSGISVSAWVTSNTSSSAPFLISLTPSNCSSAVTATQGATVTATSGTWVEATASMTTPGNNSGCDSLQVTLVPKNSGTSVQIDAVEFSITTTTSAASLPTVWRPNVVATFDSLGSSPLKSGYSSGLAINSTETGLQANNTDYWMTNSIVGSTPGDFDISYKVYFQGGSGNNNQKAGFGFWLDNDYDTMDGYCFSLHTNDGDGGFAQNCKTNYDQLTKIGKVSRGTWYEVRLTAVGGTVTAYVTDVESDSVVTTSSIEVTGSTGGVFGQVPLGTNQDNGFLWDDLTFYSLANQTGQQATTYAPNLVKYGDGMAFEGSGYGTLNANSVSGASFEYSTGETPTQGTTYAYSMWMRSSSGTVSGTVDLDAIGGDSDENVSTSFSVGTTWTQVAVNLTVADDDHTDLRPGVTITSTSANQLYLDDQVLQEVPWNPVGSTTVAVSDNEAYSGTDSLAIINYSQGSQAVYTFDEPPAAGSTATITGWVMTPGQAVSGDLRIGEASGWSKDDFTATATWQQVSVTRTLQGGTEDLYIAVNIDGGQAAPIYVDDVTVTVQGTTSTQTGDVGAPPAPIGWVMESDCSSVTDDSAVVSSDPSVAYRSIGSLLLAPVENCTTTASYASTVTPALGSTWKSSVYVAGSTTGNYVTITLSSGANSTSTTVAMTTAYQQVLLTLPITTTAGLIQIAISNTNTNGTKVAYVDNVSVIESGLSPVDDWTFPSSSGPVSIIAIDDANAAHSGNNYLSVVNNGSGSSSIYLDDDSYTPVSGTAHEMSFWVLAPAGTVNGSAALTTYDANGASLDTYSVSFAATSSWQQVYISLPIKKTTAVSLRTQISLPRGATLAIDDVESRDVDSWSALQPSSGRASITIIDGVSDAVDGMNYLRFNTSAQGGGVTDTITADTDGDAIDVAAGSSYELTAYVRSTTGINLPGRMALGTSAGEGTSVGFTATADWTKVQVTLQAQSAATSLTPQITLNGSGQLDVDALTITPLIINQSDPWSAAGSGVTWQVVDDPANAHDGSYGLMKFTTTSSSNSTGVQQTVDQASNVGDQYSVNAWVRSSSPTTQIKGTVQVSTIGGTQEQWAQNFTADDTWQSVSIPMTIAQAGHTGFTVAVLSKTPGVMLYLDDVTMQSNMWIASSSAVTQTIVYDGASAQSGSSYLELDYVGSGSGSTYYDMAASDDIGGVYSAGTTWIATAYVRSSSSTDLVTGQVGLGDPAGTPTLSSFSVGDAWTPVSVSYTVGSTDLTSLRVQLFVSGSSVPLDVDSITISDGTPVPDGITTALPHPDSGYVYLWDEAFGIPGAHLWAASAQVDFSDGVPGLGVSATLYQDPTKMSQVMTGTDWIKGDMAINFSEDDPCFLFDFSTTGDSGVSLGEGVFTANDFAISFAAQGCQVGSYTLAQGASVSFDGELGDGSLSFDLMITEDADGPVFSEDLSIADITVGGIDFQDMELSIYQSTTDDSITFVGDMAISAGNFDGSFDLLVNEDELRLDGSASLSDWSWAGGGFDLEEFDFDIVMDVPFGAGECGTFTSDTSGLMSMASKTSLSFVGDISINCGDLDTLHFEYDYSHGAITQTFDLDYDSSTDILAGGVTFTFERSTSWKFWFHKFNRHPYFNVSLEYSMNVNKPASTLDATLSGTVSVSGGSGSLTCTINAGSGTDWADDECSIDVQINVGGGHEYKASW